MSRRQRDDVSLMLPVGPLLDAIEAAELVHPVAVKVLRCPYRLPFDWRAGRVTELSIYDADAYGTRLAGHPVRIWPEWFELTACDEVEVAA